MPVPTMRRQVNVPLELDTQVTTIAKRDGLSLTAAVLEALRLWVAARNGERTDHE